MAWIMGMHPVLQGLAATLFTYFVTAAGAALVLFVRSVNRRFMDLMMGFAGGVMIAASFWSLLEPAIELAETLGGNAWLTAAGGFIPGGLFVIGSDLLLERAPVTARYGEGARRSILLVTAVTLHNIPEGLAVGVAFGVAALEGGGILPALLLALGIGLQNFPEGACVSMPLAREGMSRWKAFLWGQASGQVEPEAGVLGVMCALAARQVLPLALAFSAGAMIAVVCSELIPESFKDNKILAALGVLAGFVVMMVLDVALG